VRSQLFYDTDVNALFLGSGAGGVEGGTGSGTDSSSNPPSLLPQWTRLTGAEELRVSVQTDHPLSTAEKALGEKVLGEAGFSVLISGFWGWGGAVCTEQAALAPLERAFESGGDSTAQVRGEITGSQKYGIVGNSQWVLVMIDPITRRRRRGSTATLGGSTCSRCARPGPMAVGFVPAICSGGCLARARSARMHTACTVSHVHLR
jgi:hypothetical protein